MKTLTWQHVALIGALLGAVVAVNYVAPGQASAFTGVVTTIIAYLTKPQVELGS